MHPIIPGDAPEQSAELGELESPCPLVRSVMPMVDRRLRVLAELEAAKQRLRDEADRAASTTP